MKLRQMLIAVAAMVPVCAMAECPPEDELPEGTVCLEWQAPSENADGTPLTDLAGFNVYYGVRSGSYGDPIPVPLPDATSAELVAGEEIIIDAPPGGGDVEMFFAMTALDDAGNEAVLSNEVSRTVRFADKLPPAPATLRRVIIKIAT